MASMATVALLWEERSVRRPTQESKPAGRLLESNPVVFMMGGGELVGHLHPIAVGSRLARSPAGAITCRGVDTREIAEETEESRGGGRKWQVMMVEQSQEAMGDVYRARGHVPPTLTVRVDEIKQGKTGINSRMLLDASTLSSMQQGVRSRIKLEAIGDYLCEEFAKRVEKGDRAV